MIAEINFESKLHEIAHALLSQIYEGHNVSVNNNLGLYGGHIGILFFLTHYANRYNLDEKNQHILDLYTEACLEELMKGTLSYNYSMGLSGILSTLQLLNDSDLLNIDYSDIETAYYPHMLVRMDHEIASGNYDFMHGGLGAALYFSNDETFMEHAVNGLDNMAEKSGKWLRWTSSLGINQPTGYNIALSHGISSIIVYLSRIYNKGVAENKIESLLHGAVNYVLSQEIDRTIYGSYFPSQSLDNGEAIHKSRLAWCYGDLGVAAALWQAGKAVHSEEWKNKAIEIYKYSVTKRVHADTMINDAGICHGSAGVAMMFGYMFRETGMDIFRQSKDHWISTTLDMARFSDGVAGYKVFRTSTEGNVSWENNYELLEGVAGIGLMLQAASGDYLSERNLYNCMILY